MSKKMPTQVKVTPTPSFAPVRSDLLQRKCACGGSAGLDGMCEDCRGKRLQRRATNGVEPTAVPSIVHEVLRSPGEPLDPSTRAFMEPRFGHDFSKVRVHTDTKAARSASMLSARAYTVGGNIVFGVRQYMPATVEGKRLLAHELTHVIQQRVRRGGQIDNQSHEMPSALKLGTSDSNCEREAIGISGSVLDNSESQFLQYVENKGMMGYEKRIINRLAVPAVQRVTEEEFALMQRQNDHHQLLNNWFPRYLNNLETNARNDRLANERFINFEENAISQLRTTGSVAGGVAYLFGTPGAVVALSIIILTEVAAQNLSGKSAKIAAAAAKLDEKYRAAILEITRRNEELHDQINSTSSFDWGEWAPIWNTIANLGVPEIVPENIIYRDLLLEFARQGGYNISGSEWNVRNMSLFGNAPWYHSWDWGSPGWINGQDIADELNTLAQSDPSTRKTVRINPP